MDFIMFRRSLRACAALVRLKTTEALQYRMAGLAGASVGVFWALIQIVVFTLFYTYGANRGADIAMTLPQLVRFVWLQEMFWWIVVSGIPGDINAAIDSGDVGIELCRPLDLYMHWYAKTMANGVGNFWWRMVIAFAVALLLPAGYCIGAPESAAGFALFLVSLCMAYVLSTAVQMLMVGIRMDVTWGRGPMFLAQMVVATFSGGYLPLQLWPDFMQGFLKIQPFAGMMDLPFRLYLGTMPIGEAWSALALQLSWAVIFVLAGRWLIRKRLKNIIVQGG